MYEITRNVLAEVKKSIVGKDDVISKVWIALLAEGHEDVPLLSTRNGREIHVDVEEAKERLLRLTHESGVEIFLHTPVVEVLKDGCRVTGVLAGTALGLQELHASVVIDATGDGFAAMRAGAQYHIGREQDGRCQPVTIEFLVDHLDESRALSCFGGSDPVTLPDGKKYSQLCRECCERGELPQNVSIVRLHKTFYPGERNVNATQANGLDILTPKDEVTAELTLRAQIDKIISFLRKYVPGYENCRVKSSAATLGVRETRRIEGLRRIEDIDVKHLLLLSEGNCLRDQVLELCQARRRVPAQYAFESGSLDTLMRIVDNTANMTIIPELALDFIPKEKHSQIKTLAKGATSRKITIAVRRTYVKRSLISALKESIIGASK